MTTYEQKDMTGVLFKNVKREKESQPNARGTALIGGVLYEVAAWTKVSKAGKPYQSLSFKVQEQPPQGKQSQYNRNVEREELDDEVPF